MKQLTRQITTAKSFLPMQNFEFKIYNIHSFNKETRLESTGTSPEIWNLDFDLWTLDFFYDNVLFESVGLIHVFRSGGSLQVAMSVQVRSRHVMVKVQNCSKSSIKAQEMSSAAMGK